MPERSSLNQTIQIGVESTSGTAVAASKRMQSWGLEPTIETEIDQFKPAGWKYNALTSLGKEWATSPITGRGSFTELVYILSSVIDVATITTPGGGTTSRNWQFISDTFADDAPKTYTVEHGSSVRADRFTYGLITEFGMTFNRTSVEVTGSMMGRALEDGITMTASPTSVALIPILPTQISVYVDATAAGLGTTKLTRAVSTEFNIGSRFAPVWVLDAAQNPFAAHIESDPDFTVGLVVQANSAGMAYLANMRSGAALFIRIEAIGAIIEGAIPYKAWFDFCVRATDPEGFRDEDGVYCFSYNFVGGHDATWAKSMDINLVNTLTAL
jgi:hypothetical protein